MESRRNSSDSPIKQKSKKSRYSYDPIHTLPPEIIVEILSRLPVKSLLKFRCVSKSWLSLISSPQFIKTHLKISTNDPNFTSHRIMFTTSYPRFNLKNCTLRSLLYEPLTDAVSISYPRKHSRRSVWVVGSCNGLICIAINEKDLFLWNPSVRKSKKLPNVDVPMGQGFYIVYGFGFDETNEDYKVVGIFCAFGNAGGYETMLHWSASPGVGFSSGWDIVSLDVEREIYGMLEQPNYGEGGFASLLGVLGGSVCVICDYQKTRADVWVLKEYGIKESWTKVVTIPYIDEPGRYMYSIPLCILRNGEVLLALGSSYVVYNPKENSFRFPKISNADDFLEANTYIESLVSPAAVMVDQE
ncbi:F-box/kelch-repeat protein [Forsythia ovata]|uniref:F-box/kelch-repeat protein n=1 Tax=Forsythia ovata TaxID=205694 RepID=A0ABD1P751_9LAMI